jgi:hypothetical protein
MKMKLGKTAPWRPVLYCYWLNIPVFAVAPRKMGAPGKAVIASHVVPALK